MPDFHSQPILNSPYTKPSKHWALDDNDQPTGAIKEERRPVSLVTPIPVPKPTGGAQQLGMALSSDSSIKNADRMYLTTIINGVRTEVDKWRDLPETDWGVTPTTARLLKHWRHHDFERIRPFFCQVEAAETVIWLHEVAPKSTVGNKYLTYLRQAQANHNPDLFRIALKMATGAGKTTVMAMLIAWQTLNSVRSSINNRYTRGFLIVTPGITIKDRLRVLLPNAESNYFKDRELVPQDMLNDMQQAKIVITNYHAFMQRERIDISKGARNLLQGHGADIQTLETEGQMLQRVIPELIGMKHIVVINDEAHHCYRLHPDVEDRSTKIKGEDADQAEENSKAARVWIKGLEAIQRLKGNTNKVITVYDLSATPFFLSGSGYEEGTLFPWTMSDFSLMDAIECGIVKLPRIPISDGYSDDDPMYRNLWDKIRDGMPRKNSKNSINDPEQLPPMLKTALRVLYEHYERVNESWQKANIVEPPCFIVVCNNTLSSKLVYEYITGYTRVNAYGETIHYPGVLPLFTNYGPDGEPLERPNALLIDSAQLEAGGELDASFKQAASEEIEQFRRQQQRMGIISDKVSDADLLREVMNTVGKPGKLGAQIRCVVSVSMLTEGWDTNTVTHILGLRAFGTQLLCEQVIGRALRRQSYDLNDVQLFDAEYADVFGIPFNFSAKPVPAAPTPPKPTVQVKALETRAHCEITFPNIVHYQVSLPNDILDVTFTEASHMTLDAKLTGPITTMNGGIVGAETFMELKSITSMRAQEVITHLARTVIMTRFLDANGEPKNHLYPQLFKICQQWFDEYLHVKDNGTHKNFIHYEVLRDIAAQKITDAITASHKTNRPTIAIPATHARFGSTSSINFVTTKTHIFEPRHENPRCHTNYIIGDSGWELEFARLLDNHPRVIRYIKNQGMGFQVPYAKGSSAHWYVPDFIAHIDDGHGPDDPLQVVIEIKGERDENDANKANTMCQYWVPGVNNVRTFGRWAFIELEDNATFGTEFDEFIAKHSI
jgi:type III restriction enzyme